MRPSNKKPDDLADRVAIIGGAISRVGPSLIATECNVTDWSVYKWRNKGFVTNEHLALFCRLTGLSPKDVCDPSIRDLVKSRLPNATKSRNRVV